MTLRYLFSCLLLCSGGAWAQKAQDTPQSSPSNLWWQLTSPQYQLSARTFTDNPLLRWTLPHQSVTNISLNGVKMRQQEQSNYQQGDGYRNFSITADSHIILSPKSIVWGGASYINGKTSNVRFNDNADIDLIYPYVMADTKGGEMKSEHYLFNGGYLHRLKSNLLLTAELDYRALISYRDKDPRPKNSVSDLTFRLGVGHTFQSSYVMGVTINARKYKQFSSIKQLSSTKQTPIYHLAGLGQRMAKFDGTFTDSNHEGHAYGMSIGINQMNNNGWIANLSYNSLRLKKIMPSVNNLPLQRIKERKFETNIGFNSSNWSLLLIGDYTNRKGYEHLYSAPHQGYYKILTTIQPYTQQTYRVGVKGVWQTTSKKTNWYIIPHIGTISSTEKYNDPKQQIKLNKAYINLTAIGRINTQHLGIFSCTQNLGYEATMNKKIELADVENNPMQPLNDQMAYYLGKNKMAGRTTLRWDPPFTFFSMQYFTAVSWETQKLDAVKPMHTGEFKLGIIF